MALDAEALAACIVCRCKGSIDIAHACAEDPNAIGAGGVEYQDFVARRLMAIGDGGQFGDI